MFRSWLKFQGTNGVLLDACEENPIPMKYFSSRSRSLRMLGTVRANVELFWLDPSINPQPGMIIKGVDGSYYIIVKPEYDATVINTVNQLITLNVLEFTSILQGYETLPQTSLNIFGDYTPGLPKRPKSIRACINLSTNMFEDQVGGVLPLGNLTIITSTCCGVKMSDEYTWGGNLFRVEQVNPVEAAGQIYAYQVILKQTEVQRLQIT